MNYEKVAKEILAQIGTFENVEDVTHCFTRLRFTLIDPKKVALEQVKAIDGVIDARLQSGQLQIIIGNEVAKVYAAMYPYVKKGMKQSGKQPATAKHSILDTVFTTIAALFTPILPAIIGAGLMKGILPLLVIVKVVSEGSDTYQILTVIADTSFTFLPVLIAISAARRFKVNEFLSVTLACAMLYPTIANGEGTLYLFDRIPIPLMTYSTTVIPIILGVWMMSYIYRWVDRFVPNVVKMILTPLIVLSITIPLTLAVFGPIGSYVGTILATVSLWLTDTVPFLYGLLIGGFYPLIIVTGMHYAFFPIMLENISHLGYENGFLPISLFANIAMAAATLAIAFKVSDKQRKEVSFSAAVSAFFGITEPALYGVILNYKKVLYAVMIASGLTSAVMITLGVKMFAFLTPGILSLSVFVHPDTSMNNLLTAVVGIVASGGIVFLLTFIVKIPTLPEKTPADTTKEDVFCDATEEVITEKKGLSIVLAPISGHVNPLEQSSDDVFAEGMVGKGVLIEPTDNQLYAPFTGKVSALIPEKHAIGLISSEGVEVLIHIGVDTIELKGEGFEVFVALDDSINVGQPLLAFNRQLIAEKGYSTETLVIVTNTSDYFEVVPMTTKKEISSGDELITIIH